jgi:hypothetical protein
VAVAMKSTLHRTKRRVVLLGLVTGVGLVDAVACRSIDDATPGERVVYPTPQTPAVSSSAAGAATTPDPDPKEVFSPFDIAIASDCLPISSVHRSRPWSQNVPERDCTEDSECGDGHCDRGRCRAIWTCTQQYGQRCIDGQTVPTAGFKKRYCRGICIDGRCRSCVSDQECIDKPGPDDGCGDHERDGHRGCGVTGPHGR